MQESIVLLIGGPHRNDIMAVPNGVHRLVCARSRLLENRSYAKRDGDSVATYETGAYCSTNHITRSGYRVFEWMGWENGEI